MPGRHFERAGGVDPIQAENNVGLRDKRAHLPIWPPERRRRVQRMVGRECRAGLEVAQDPRVQQFGQSHPVGPALGVARNAAGKDQGPFGVGQKAGGSC